MSGLREAGGFDLNVFGVFSPEFAIIELSKGIILFMWVYVELLFREW